MKLVTPLGEIDILIDGIEIEYDFQMVDVDSSCKDVDGRYAIQVSLVPDGREHIISCKIRDYLPSEFDDKALNIFIHTHYRSLKEAQESIQKTEDKKTMDNE